MFILGRTSQEAFILHSLEQLLPIKTTDTMFSQRPGSFILPWKYQKSPLKTWSESMAMGWALKSTTPLCSKLENQEQPIHKTRLLNRSLYSKSCPCTRTQRSSHTTVCKTFCSAAGIPALSLRSEAFSFAFITSHPCLKSCCIVLLTHMPKTRSNCYSFRWKRISAE